MNTFYTCSRKNNPCRMAMTCKRYLEYDSSAAATLWRMACIHGGLYMKADISYEHYLNCTEDHGCL